MLGKLASYLRMCGHDAVYAGDRGVTADDRLATLARREGRRLLTRDRQLAARTDDGLLVESTAIDAQLRELRAAGVRLTLADEPARCGRCNGRVERPPADAERPEYVPAADPVWRCRDCDQWFWKGSHWEQVADRLAVVRGVTDASRE